jgi:hypothetical protein
MFNGMGNFLGSKKIEDQSLGGAGLNGLENKKLLFSSKMTDVNFIDENLKTTNFLNMAKPLNPADCKPDAAQRPSTDSLYFSNDGNSRANNKKYMTFNETDSPARSNKQLHPIIDTPQSTFSPSKIFFRDPKPISRPADLFGRAGKPHESLKEEENLFNKKCEPLGPLGSSTIPVVK